MYDIIIVGGGPAGLTAALYAKRNGKHALVLEKAGFGGQITQSPKVENIPGLLSVSGNEFADRLLDQVLYQGGEIEIETVDHIEDRGKTKAVVTEEGEVFEAEAVIIATGVRHRLLGLEGEEDFIGDGISFCALCDGDFYKGRKVCVIGGGNSALQEAVLLCENCSEVVMIQDLPEFTGEAKLQEALFSHDNVKKHTNMKVNRILSENGEFRGIEVENKISGERWEEYCDGMFVAIGLIPENGMFAPLVDLDERGYFDSNELCRTKTEGIFVAGDCRKKRVRQVATAVADGATAALAACEYINSIS